ncbi:MAG TPA: transcription termination factor NusA [Anaerolineae bacterium]|nr:transcription termination factor NusA [Anaerolineae bacterium]
MKTDFIRAINQVCAERGLTVEVVLEALEQALVSAYKRDIGPYQHLDAKIDPSTGEVKMFTGREVVETVEDPDSQVTQEEARQIRPGAELGEIIYLETTPPDFGRIAAQTAKQVILQRIREAERDALYESFVEREGEIVGGTVHSVDARGVTVNLGRIEALVPRSQQVSNERYYTRQKLRVLVLEVNKTSRGPEIIASRSHPDMLRRLLEVEVPEIYNGLVEIKAIAREAGSRAKVAVAALQPGIDPVGACVGMRGVRIQSIVSELNGEKIDVIGWSHDPREFIAKSLSPARPLGVELSEDREMGRTATVIVPDKELSLAIGREGQNARLAAKLTGWRIDIISATEAAELAMRRAEQEAARAAARAQVSEDMPLERLGLSKRIVNALESAGIVQLGHLLDAMDEGEEALLKLKGFGEKSLQETKQVLKEREAREILGREWKPKKAEVAPEPEEALDETALLEEEAILADQEAEEAQAEPAEEEPSALAITEEAEVSPLGEEILEAPKPVVADAEPPETQEEESLESSEPEQDREPELDLVLGDKQAAKKKRPARQLVYDESLGEVVAKKVRKPGRSREAWEEETGDWTSPDHETLGEETPKDEDGTEE